MRRTFSIKSLFVVIATFLSAVSFATDYYWIGGSGFWNNPTNWSLSSGGGPAGSIPSASDNVYFDNNSFSDEYQRIFLAGDVSAKNFYITSTSYPVFDGESANLIIGGDLEIVHKTHFDLGGEVRFSSSDMGTHHIDIGPNDIYCNIRILGGNWELANHLKTNRDFNLYLSGGSLITNNYTLFGNLIYANESTFTLTAGDSYIIAPGGMFLSSIVSGGSGDTKFYTESVEVSAVDRGDFEEYTFRDVVASCTVTDPLVITTTITSDYNGFNVSCFGACDGAITIGTAGTPGPFSYDYPGDGLPALATNISTTLCGGPNTFVVTDSSNEIFPGSGFFASCSFGDVLTEPFELSINLDFLGEPTCPAVCDAPAITTLFGGVNPTITWPVSGETTPFPVGLCEGVNPANIIDDNGCTLDTFFVVTGKPAFTFPAVITPPTCAGDCDAEIDPDPAGGNGAPYTITWSPIPGSGVNSDPGVGFCAGMIMMTVEDVDGCTADTTYEIIDPPVLSVTVINIVDALCNGDCNGEAEANPVGGVPPYDVEWFDDATGLTTGLTGLTTNALCAGDYYAEVTDASGCVVQSLPFTIGEPPVFAVSALGSAVSCPGDCDGTTDGTIGGGTPPYTPSWVTVPGGIGVGATEDLAGLCAGDYELTVTDFNGCVAGPVVVSVTEPLPLTLAISGTDPSCYDLCDGSANAVVGDGTPPYSYVWTPAVPTGAGTPTPSDLCAGTYSLLVTDFNGCTITDNVTLNSPATFDITGVVTDVDCFGDTDGAIDLTINTGGSGVGYTFVWAPVPPVGDGTANISGLSTGVWTVTVADDQGCDTTLSFTVSSPSELIVGASVISQVSCFGDCDGSANVNILGGTPGYSILWDDPGAQTTPVASGLCEGTYNVTVTDFNGCVETDLVVITQPLPYDIIVGQTDLDCFGDCDATATVTVNSGGTPVYTYLWDDPLAQTTPTAVGLCAGTYTCTVSDAFLCDTVLTFIIAEPAELLVTIAGSGPSCFGACDGTAEITIVGGTPIYNIEWFDAVTLAPQGVNNTLITGLCPGDYFAEVTDANGCVTISPVVTITELPSINISIDAQTDATCGFCDGTADLSATGGAGGFSFDWTPDPTISGDSPNATGLCGGAYNVVVTDAAGCTQSIVVTVNSSATEVMDLDSTDVTCFGLCDGTLMATFVEIDPPYTIEWFDETTGLTTGLVAPGSGIAVGPVCAGSYIAVLTNGSGCVVTDTLVVNEPPEITGSVTSGTVACFGDCDGTLTATATGGTGTLDYTWSPLPGTGQGTPTAGGLCAGNWTVTVTDDNGCFINLVGTISEPLELVITLEDNTDITCFGANDGTATIGVAGGIGPYNYEWFDCATGLPIGQTTPVATGLPPGSYQAVVTDDNGCTVTGTCQTITEPSGITGVANLEFISCFGDCNGMIDFVPAGGTPPYFYQWQDEFGVDLAGQTDDTLSNACQGIYNLVVTDLAGCTQAFGPFDLTSPTSPWDVLESQTDITCSGTCDGTATVNVIAGNTPPYTYLWDDPGMQVGPTAVGLCPGPVTVIITDATTLCDTAITFNIIDSNPIIANAAITNVLCFGDCSGEITANPSGGTGPYTISYSNGDIGPTTSGLCAGAITLSITDAAGCFIDTIINITENPEILVTSSFSNNASCGLCNGSATVNVSGGVSPYSYDWTPDPTAGEGTNNATGLCSGITSVLITDDVGCTFVETFGISDIGAEVLATTSNDASCFGVCDGDAEVLYVCSDPTCSQEWFDSATGLSMGITTPTITGLCAGDYLVEVVNNSGCISVEPVTISSPSQIIANEVITNLICNGDNNASIELFPTGGSGAGYNYAWSPVPPNGDGTNEALNLTAGTWDVTITDGSGCSELLSYTIVDPPAIVIMPTSNNMSCSGVCDGSISITVSGGAGGFTFQWFNGGALMPGETGTSLVGLCAGNYNVEVTDLNGCVVTLPADISIGEPVPLSSTIASTDVQCFGACDGEITLTIAGGTPPYSVNWFDSATGGIIGITGETASGLCPGDYFAIIIDGNGCGFTTTDVTITEPTELTEGLVVNDASCFGVCDGDAALNLAGGTLPYSYQWLDISGAPIPGSTDPSVINLCGGNYTVEGFDANGCTVGPIAFAVIEFPEITGTVFTNDATCGVPDGNATINPVGGNPPYSYQWFDDLLVPLAGETSNTLLGVTSGTYYVEVTDLNGCTQIFSGNISDLPSTTVTFDAINDPLCNGGNDGSIEITATGVNPPLSFTWNPGGIVAEDPTGLTAGDYTLEIVDGLGCLNYYSATLVDPPSIIVSGTTTPTDCGFCNGEINLTVSGGTGTLDILWNTGATGTTLTGLCAGFYEVTVTDDNGCIEVVQFEITNNAGFDATTLVTGLTCPGACDGEITVTPTGGTAPYSILWLHDASTSFTISGLCADTYFTTVTDDVGCQVPIIVDIVDPNPISATETINTPACGASDGSITVLTTGGVLPHTYLWSTGGTSNVETGLGAGVYTLTVTDNAGCSEVFTFTLNNTDAPSTTLISTDLNCHGVCDGTGDTLAVIGNNPPFIFDWLDASGTSLGVATPAISGLCAGDYILEVEDAFGCFGFGTMTINEPDTMILNPLFEIDPTCNGVCDGSIISNPIGGTPGYTFSWDDPGAQTTSTASALCDGTFMVTITDNNGCSVTQTGTLAEPPSVTVVVDSVDAATCLNAADGAIWVTASGGTPGYTYQWVSQTLTDTLTAEDPSGLLPMEYYLEITDLNGCIALDTVVVDTMLVVLADAGLDTSLCFPDTLLIEGLSNVGPPTDYTWFDSTGVNIVSDTSVLNFANLDPGNTSFILLVDYNGCTHTDTITILMGDSLWVEAGDDIDIYPLSSEVIGGSPTSDISSTWDLVWTPSIYMDDPTAFNPTITDLDSSLWYYAQVTDSLGCTRIDSMYVTLLPELDIPDGISPDGNGLNDTWILEFMDQYPGVSITIEVYNRWGDLLFQSDETYNDDWGGTTEDGKRLPAGTYYYVIDVDHEDFPEAVTGPITIMW